MDVSVRERLCPGVWPRDERRNPRTQTQPPAVISYFFFFVASCTSKSRGKEWRWSSIVVQITDSHIGVDNALSSVVFSLQSCSPAGLNSGALEANPASVSRCIDGRPHRHGYASSLENRWMNGCRMGGMRVRLLGQKREERGRGEAEGVRQKSGRRPAWACYVLGSDRRRHCWHRLSGCPAVHRNQIPSIYRSMIHRSVIYLKQHDAPSNAPQAMFRK